MKYHQGNEVWRNNQSTGIRQRINDNQGKLNNKKLKTKIKELNKLMKECD